MFSEIRPPNLLEEEQRMEFQEIKSLVERRLRTAFEGILEPEELEQRLADLSTARVLSPEEFTQRIEAYPEEADADGIMHVEVVGRKVQRSVFLKAGTRSEMAHTLAHEATHLMAPQGGILNDPMRDKEDEVYSVYLGPLRHERFVQTGQVDVLSVLFDRVQARALFWEAFTDWHADHLLVDELSDPEIAETAESGYIERYYIAHLINMVPEKEAFIRAMRTAYASGYDDAFRWEMERISGREDSLFYEELLDVLATPLNNETWQQRLDDWMATVKKYLPVEAV